MTGENGRYLARSEFSELVSKALENFDLYGLGVYIPDAHRAIVDASEKFANKMLKEFTIKMLGDEFEARQKAKETYCEEVK